MSRLFKNYAAQANISQRQILEVKYTNSRHNILFLIAFTVVNAVMLLTQAGSYFLFSAYVPYFMIDLGMFLCGKYPAEDYAEFSGMAFLDDSFLVMMCVFAAIIVGIYLLCWFMSKKKAGWLVAALVLVSLDTVAILLWAGIDVSLIIDYVFHAYVIYSLAAGVAAHRKLKNLPAEEAVLEVADFEEIPSDEPTESVAAEIAPEATLEATPEVAPEAEALPTESEEN